MFALHKQSLVVLAIGLVTAVFPGFTLANETDIVREQVPLFGATGDMVIGPGKVEYVIPPGEQRSAEVMITNRLGEEATFSLSVEDAAGSRDPHQGIVLLGNDRGPYTLKDYVSFPITEITLAHGERARIPVTIEIPADAEPGGRYGSVLVSVISDTSAVPAPGSNAAPKSVLVSRVGSLYFITVPGEVATAGSLQDFATMGNQWFFTDSPVDFEILFENTGSVHLNPYGAIAVRNVLGDVIARTEIEPWFAMPQSLRYFEASVTRSQLFGVYEASLDLNRGYGEVSDTAAVRFMVIPQWFITSVLSVCVLLVLWRVWRLVRVRAHAKSFATT